MHKAQDWHPADIIALARRWPKGERRKAKGERRKDYCGFPECITGRHLAFALQAKNILMIINKNPGSRGTERDPGTMHYVTPVSAGFWLH